MSVTVESTGTATSAHHLRGDVGVCMGGGTGAMWEENARGQKKSQNAKPPNAKKIPMHKTKGRPLKFVSFVWSLSIGVWDFALRLKRAGALMPRRYAANNFSTTCPCTSVKR